MNTQVGKTLGNPTSHTPNFADVDAVQQSIGVARGQVIQIADAIKRRSLLGNVIGELSQRLGGADTDAYGQTHPLWFCRIKQISAN